MADERDKEITDWLNGSGSTVVLAIVVILAIGFIVQIVKGLL